MFLENIKSIEDFKKINQKDLKIVADEIREEIIKVVEKNGGHLSSNLGSVELTLAIHYVFNSPKDKIIFDVGHQSYTHKILTGRYDRFNTIRLKNGLSGFTRKSESIHDITDSGHASTSISIATGMAEGLRKIGDDSKVIVVIGDGALTGGVAFEGLNYCGHSGLPLIIILNDNEMSIGRNVGALSKYINKLALLKFYQNLTDDIEGGIKKSKNIFKGFLSIINKLRRTVKLFFDYENVFTAMGIEYLGPIDGHNLDELIYIFRKVKTNVKHPILLHVKTQKGKGLKIAENDPEKYHGISPGVKNIHKNLKDFDNKSSEKEDYRKLNENEKNNEDKKIEIKEKIDEKIDKEKNTIYTEIFREKIVELANRYQNIVTITAAMKSGTGLDLFEKYFPDRFFDVGIAEEHSVSFASGLANVGFKPYVCIYSTFLTRAVDQIIQDIAIGKSDVVFIIDRAGIVGQDGETHNGQFDISFLNMIPDITIMAPCCKEDLELMLDYSYYHKGPLFIRFPKEKVVSIENFNFEKEEYIYHKIDSKKISVVIGTFYKDLLSLQKEYKNFSILLLRVLKPLRLKEIIEILKNYEEVVFIEENVFSGSISSIVASNLDFSIKKTFITIPDKFVEHGFRNEILDELGFSIENFKNRLVF